VLGNPAYSPSVAVAGVVPGTGDFWADSADEATLLEASRHEADRLIIWLFLVLSGLVGLVFSAVASLVRGRFRHRDWLTLIWAILLVVVAFGGVSSAESPNRSYRDVNWLPGLSMLADHPMGVGPGQFERFLPRYVAPADADLPPTSAYLKLAATCGWPALIALLLTLAVGFWRVRRSVIRCEDRSTDPPLGTRWELYLGGIAGLLGGFVLQVYDLPPSPSPPIRELGATAAVRALAWFVTLAVASGTPWMRRLSDAMPVISMIAAAAFGLACEASLAPDIAQVVAVLAAVALNLAAPPAASAWARSGVGRLVPVLVTVPLAAAFIGLVAVPGVTSAWAVWQARLAAHGYPARVKKIDQADALGKREARVDAAVYIDRTILRPLTAAVRADPDAAGPLLEQVPWWMAMWELGAPVKPDENAIMAARYAQARDPESVAGYLAELRVRLRFAEATPTKRGEQFKHVDDLIRAVVERDPARAARLRFQVARVYFAVKDTKAGMEAAAAALKLDSEAPGPRYRLRDDERAQVRKWLNLPAVRTGERVPSIADD
ncbi:MAG TPA: O-antigen ligase family protein, partial [Gemmataceae bacterium]